MTVPAEVVRALEGAERVLLTSHVPPDGDGVGAGIALVRMLRDRGAHAVLATGGPVQENLAFLLGEGEADLTPGGPPGPFDAAVALDSGSFARLGKIGPRCRECPVFLSIDHHATNERYGSVNWVDPAAPATGVMVHRLLRAMGVELDERLATPLYVALVTDTGRLSYSNTTPEAHRMAADLLEAGVRPAEVTDRLYRSWPPAFLNLWGLGIAALETAAGDLVAHLTVTGEMVERSGADIRDLGDLVDLPMMLAGVEVGVLFRDLPGGGTKVSLRSRSWFSVSDFAARWGGGGHARAAGATLPVPPGEAREIVLDALEDALAEAAGGGA